MRFNDHSNLSGQHAFLSASKYSWIRYSDERLAESFVTTLAAMKGTELHGIADSLIKNKIKLPESRKTLNLYVNECIGYRMNTEQVLYYSKNAFGTADAMSFRKEGEEMVLRISDLKTGVSKASFDQLMIYVAFFCLEYNIKPAQIIIELRIYQNDDVEIFTPEINEIINIMDTLVRFDSYIDDMRREAFE
jgi:hypothetical protein